MAYRRTTLSKFIIDDQRRGTNPQPELTSLLNDVQTACKLIAVAVSRGALLEPHNDDARNPLEAEANSIMLATCEWGGQLAGMMSGLLAEPYRVPGHYPRGRYLLVFDPLDGADNIDVDVPVGTIFSVLRCPDGVTDPAPQDFLQPGTAQVAAGYAIYGPVAMMTLTVGNGVHGFTLDREIGAFCLTHPGMTIPPATRDFAVDMSGGRFWDPPVRRYVDECIAGESGPRDSEFNMRWTASTVAEMHRILLRGGLFMGPQGGEDGLRLLTEAAPIAMIIEQAGGKASNGHRRVLDIVPDGIDHKVPVMAGSRDEIERLERYFDEHARGEDPITYNPLFNVRSLFRTA